MLYKQKVILLVEDEILIAMSEQLILKSFGYEVIIANNSTKALECISNNEIHLILMDIDLGSNSLDGTELAKQILTMKELPIVFCTSHSEREMVDKVKGITRYGYILKSSGQFVINESITMAFELFNSHIKIKESEEKYRAAFYTSPDSVNINRMDGLYVDINEGFKRLTGYSESDVIGKLSSEIDIWAIPEDRQKLIKSLQDYGYIENLESTFRCKDGSFKIAIMSARIIIIDDEPHILSVTRDITDRRAIAMKLEENEKRYRGIIQGTSDGFWLINKGGKIIDVNESYCKMSGYTKDELLTMSINNIDVDDDEIEVSNKIKSIYNQGKTRFTKTHRRKDGSLFKVEITTSFLPHDQTLLSVFIREI